MSKLSAEFESAAKIWKSGDWQIELREDEFADIKFQNQIVLRSVRAVIRDRDWNTADLVIDSFSESANELKFSVHSTGFGAEFSGEVCAKVDGQVATFTMELSALSDYQTNRTGLIVLHSPDVAGEALEVTHSSGQAESLKFPVSISPNQPVFDIASLSWQHNQLQIDVAFAGDVFEMEDQRNWSDASYKTYNRPLSLPFPYKVSAGEKVLQIIKIHVQPTGSLVTAAKEIKIELTKVGKFPQIQVGASTAPNEPTQFTPFTDAVLVELDLQSTNWLAALERATKFAKALDVRAIVADLQKLEELVALLVNIPVARIAAFDSKQHVTTQATTAALRKALKKFELDIEVVSGARSHFTELNREQALILQNADASTDAITFATTPLFHSLTTEQLLESVAMQRIIAQQAVELAAGKPVHVGPITLRPRFNNVATAEQPAPTKVDLSEGYGAEFTGSNDERQSSPELAAWVIASAAALSVPGIESLTWFEQWGPRGLVSQNGQEYPAAQAVRALAQLAEQYLYIGVSPDGFVWALGASDSAGKITILASNLNRYATSVEITIEGQDSESKAHKVDLGPLSWKQLQL